jgi:hypothetical protein
MGFLPNDCNIDSGVWGIRKTLQQASQLDERHQINTRRAHCHPGTKHGIEHPTGDRYNNARRPLYLQKLAGRSLLHATHQNLLAKIGMMPVMDFQLLPDMGRMNG